MQAAVLHGSCCSSGSRGIGVRSSSQYGSSRTRVALTSAERSRPVTSITSSAGSSSSFGGNSRSSSRSSSNGGVEGRRRLPTLRMERAVRCVATLGVAAQRLSVPAMKKGAQATPLTSLRSLLQPPQHAAAAPLALVGSSLVAVGACLPPLLQLTSAAGRSAPQQAQAACVIPSPLDTSRAQSSLANSARPGIGCSTGASGSTSTATSSTSTSRSSSGSGSSNSTALIQTWRKCHFLSRQVLQQRFAHRRPLLLAALRQQHSTSEPWPCPGWDRAEIRVRAYSTQADAVAQQDSGRVPMDMEADMEMGMGMDVEVVDHELDTVEWQKELANHVNLIGNVEGEVQARAVKGTDLASFRIGVPNRRKSGPPRDMYFVDVWGPLAQLAHAEVRNGMQVAIQGRLALEVFTKLDGTTVQRVKVVAVRLAHVRGGRGSSASGNYPSAEDAHASQYSSQQQQPLQPLSRQQQQPQRQGQDQWSVAEDLWRQLFDNPGDFYDNRSKKRNPKSPDFKHKRAANVALWVDNRFTPEWVPERLREYDAARDVALAMGDRSSAPAVAEESGWRGSSDAAAGGSGGGSAGYSREGGRDSSEALWREFFESPDNFWDNRVNKRNPRAPDFKHRESGKGLWVDGYSTPQWVLTELAKYDDEEDFDSMGENGGEGDDVDGDDDEDDDDGVRLNNHYDRPAWH